MDNININALLREIATDDHWVAKSAQFVNSDIEQRRRREAGPLYDAMASSRDQAMGLLEHHDSSVQKAALAMFISRWPPDPMVEEICERFAYTGPAELRLRAITVLSFVRNHLYGEKVSNTLARFALDSALQPEVRQEVYFLLRSSFGTIEDKLAALNERQRAADDAGEIDPQIIQHCVDAEEPTRAPKLEEHQVESVRLYREAKRLFDSGALAKAENLLSSAIELWPQTAGPLLTRAKVREQLGSVDEAIVDCSAAIRLAPHVASFYRYRAMLYERIGEQVKSQTDLERAESLEKSM